jgi:death-on-curing protein
VTPTFLALDQVLTIHKYQVAQFGGHEGVRDWNLLHSAVAMPAAMFGGRFLHADLLEMAAAYLFHLVRNHAFVDGNKRVAAAAAVAFLELNNLRFTADADAYANLVLSVARGDVTKTAIAAFFRQNVEEA